MLPMVAGPLPALTTSMKPETTRCPPTVAPWVAVMVQLTVDAAGTRTPVLARVQAVSLVWVMAAFEVESSTLALEPSSARAWVTSKSIG
ncbi:MAG: hypothetical protein LAP87_11735, partial [Acidobacteriia bacterium]|nr:hypothetical protein [Terriglobia bacterium]